MGNSIGGRRKGAKVMQLDGSSFRVKPPAVAGAVLRDHPGFQLLESEEVKLHGVRARPLAHDAPLRPGRLYFLVALPRPPAPPRRAWSGALHVGARERLETLMLTRRSTSDLSFPTTSAPTTAPASPLSVAAASSEAGGGPVRLKMRLPKAQVEKLMSESRDGAEAAARIMQLCAANAGSGAATPERGILRTPERSPRFVPTPDWGGGATAFAPTPERCTRFAATPEWGTGFMMPARAGNAARTPERWPTLPRTPEYEDVKASRKEVIMHGLHHLSWILPSFSSTIGSGSFQFQASSRRFCLNLSCSTEFVEFDAHNTFFFSNIWINCRLYNAKIKPTDCLLAISS